jgi:hypothetical protein
VPVAEPRELSEPKTISPSAAPVRVKVPVVASSALYALTVAEVNAAVPKETLVMFGPLAPISSVPTVTSPVLLIVVEAIVPSVFVPVEEVKPVAKVVMPLIVGIVAVLIVAVEIVAVPIVAVPVVAEMLELKVATPVTPRLDDRVTAPVTPRVEDSVTAPVTARLDARVVAPTELSVPVELTPRVDSSKAEEVLSPSVMACNVPSTPPRPRVLSNCG